MKLEELANLQRERNGLTAGAGPPLAPPREWFELEEPDDPAQGGWNVTADGQVSGYAALWGTCHTGKPGRCVTPPRSRSGYSFYQTGLVEAEDGSQVATGRITLGTGHASLTASPSATAEHYDNTGAVVADVVARDGKHGIWVTGALRPGVTPERIRELRGASLSGDWRNIRGNLELLGLLAVNVPGFPVPRSQALTAGAGEEDEVLALVAAGVYLTEDELGVVSDEEFEAGIEKLMQASARARKYRTQEQLVADANEHLPASAGDPLLDVIAKHLTKRIDNTVFTASQEDLEKIKLVAASDYATSWDRDRMHGLLTRASAGEDVAAIAADAGIPEDEFGYGALERAREGEDVEVLLGECEQHYEGMSAAGRYDESKHPRKAKGQKGGGQWTVKTTNAEGVEGETQWGDERQAKFDYQGVRDRVAFVEKGELVNPAGETVSKFDRSPKGRSDNVSDGEQARVVFTSKPGSTEDIITSFEDYADDERTEAKVVRRVMITPDEFDDWEDNLLSDRPEWFADMPASPKRGVDAVVEVTDGGDRVYWVNPEGYNYARYIAKPPRREEDLTADASPGRARARKIAKVMREFKAGKLRDGNGKKVEERKQALAIAMKESRAVTADAECEDCEDEALEQEAAALEEEWAAREADEHARVAGAVRAAAFTGPQREKLAKKGEAMSDGSFPIRNRSDLRNAVQALGRAKDQAAAKRWIIKRARELKAVADLPAAWDVEPVTAAALGQPLFREEQHPRHPKGKEEGGQFAPKSSSSQGSWEARKAAHAKAQEELDAKQAARVREREAREDAAVAEEEAAAKEDRSNLAGPGEDTRSDYEKSLTARHQQLAAKSDSELDSLLKQAYPDAKQDEMLSASRSRKLEWLMRKPAITAAAPWDPAKHPRHPAGKREGGRFAPVNSRDLSVGDTVRYKGKEMEVEEADRGLVTLTDEVGEMYHVTPRTEGITQDTGKLVTGPGGKPMSRTEVTARLDKSRAGSPEQRADRAAKAAREGKLISSEDKSPRRQPPPALARIDPGAEYYGKHPQGDAWVVVTKPPSGIERDRIAITRRDGTFRWVDTEEDFAKIDSR